MPPYNIITMWTQCVTKICCTNKMKSRAGWYTMLWKKKNNSAYMRQRSIVTPPFSVSFKCCFLHQHMWCVTEMTILQRTVHKTGAMFFFSFSNFKARKCSQNLLAILGNVSLWDWVLFPCPCLSPNSTATTEAHTKKTIKQHFIRGTIHTEKFWTFYGNCLWTQFFLTSRKIPP